MEEEAWEKYKLAIDARNLEINLFWQRSLFYWGFTGAALVAYSELIDKHETLSFVIALLGLFLSVSWAMLNRGSKWWQENWESKIAEIEKTDKIKLFHGGENPKRQNFWLCASRFSPSKLTIGISDIFCLFWLGIIVKDIYSHFCNYQVSDCMRNLIYIFSPTVLVIVLVFLGKNSRGKD